VLGGAGVDNQDVASAALLQAGEHGDEVSGRGDRNRPTNHAETAAVRAKFARQDA
jgi:hypothetical protein